MREICDKCLAYGDTDFRNNGVRAIELLMEKQGKFDYILLETTGLADPGNSVDDYVFTDCVLVIRIVKSQNMRA